MYRFLLIRERLHAATRAGLFRAMEIGKNIDWQAFRSNYPRFLDRPNLDARCITCCNIKCNLKPFVASLDFAELAPTTAAPPCHGDLQPCLTKHHGTKTSTACLKRRNNVNSADCSEHETSIPATVETITAPISTPDTQHAGIYRILCHHYHFAGLASTSTAPPCDGDLQPCLTKHHGTKTSTACLKPWNNVNSADCSEHETSIPTSAETRTAPVSTPDAPCFDLQQFVASLPICKSSLNNM